MYLLQSSFVCKMLDVSRISYACVLDFPLIYDLEIYGRMFIVKYTCNLQIQ